MGIDYNGARVLLHFKELGVDFSETATIGRQTLSLSIGDLQRAINNHRRSAETDCQVFYAADGFAEPFLRFIGAGNIASFDYSDYQMATHLHDMNLKIAPGFHEKFSAVFDGGSLEHVFNFPVAIKNCMDMVKTGGHFISICPANNFLGHGFYQFSPELFFSVFSPANGFATIKILAFEDRPDTKIYEVIPPESLGERVTLINNRPVYLAVLARKCRHETELRIPQQSDYKLEWNKDSGKSSLKNFLVNRASALGWLNALLPGRLKNRLKRAFCVQKPGFDSAQFREIQI